MAEVADQTAPVMAVVADQTAPVMAVVADQTATAVNLHNISLSKHHPLPLGTY